MKRLILKDAHILDMSNLRDHDFVHLKLSTDFLPY